MSDYTLDPHLIPFTTTLIKRAGVRLLDYYGSARSTPKGRFDLVTDADTAIESLVLGELREHWPDYQVIAEESASSGGEQVAEWCWVLDPLDGTINFALSIPFFAVSLALLHNGDPVLGWIYDPLREELFFGQRGAGCYLNDQRLMIPAGLMRPAIIGGSTGFLEHRCAAIHRIIQRFGKLRILGSQTLHLSYVAAGRMQAAVNYEARVWDNAAGSLLIHEAGGYFTDITGHPYFPLTPGSAVLAGQAVPCLGAAAAMHDDMITLLADGTEENNL